MFWLAVEKLDWFGISELYLKIGHHLLSYSIFNFCIEFIDLALSEWKKRVISGFRYWIDISRKQDQFGAPGTALVLKFLGKMNVMEVLRRHFRLSTTKCAYLHTPSKQLWIVLLKPEICHLVSTRAMLKG